MTTLSFPQKLFACALLVAGTVVGLSGIDLVLPAIPILPEALGGSETIAQLVLAAFVLGTAVGLIVYGALGERLGRRRCLVIGLGLYALISLAGAYAPNLPVLVALRFFQGVAAAAPAVFSPGIIRALFDEAGATKAIGALSSIESLVPAVAPIAGLWLLHLGGWVSSFITLSFLAGLLALVFAIFGRFLPSTPAQAQAGSYLALLRSGVYWRYAGSQAGVLGGLLVFVFGAPVVIVSTMDGAMSDFITMQVVGVSCFIIASNLAGPCAERFGAECMIWLGTMLAVLSACALLIYALAGGNDPAWLPVLFAPMNAGLGLRGPPGFLRAIIAGDGDDDRAASLMILAILIVSAVGTALFAPFISSGLVGLAGAVTLIGISAVILLLALPEWSPGRGA